VLAAAAASAVLCSKYCAGDDHLITRHQPFIIKVYQEIKMLCELHEIENYKNPPVVKRFQKEFPEKAERAEEIFTDLMRFFWGTKRHVLDRKAAPQNPNLDFFFIMDEDMREIDQMWHIFLLYTRDYMEFCQKYFGEYLHHQPDLVPLFEREGFKFDTNLERFLHYSFDLFGAKVIERWFSASLSA
jgi:hypothetical protein